MAKKRDDVGMQSKLMNAAMAAFSRKGLNGCTMGDIADAAGLARGNRGFTYHIFVQPSKYPFPPPEILEK